MHKESFATVLIVATVLLLASVPMFGQAAQAVPGATASPNTVSDQDIQLLRQDIRSQKKQIIAANMTLTDTEATKFWPIYDQYTQETIKNNDNRYALIKEYAQNYSTMTDAQAQDYITRSAAIEQQAITLRSKYVPLFEKVVSPKQTALWFQLDRRIGLLIDLQLASMIPLVQPTK